MKNIKLIVLACAVALVLSIAAFAEAPAVDITYSNDGDIYSLTTSVEYATGLKLYSSLISFDADVVIPYDEALVGDVFDVRDTSTYETEELSANYYKDSNGLGVVNASKLDVVPVLWQFDEESGRAAALFTFQTTSNLKVQKTGELFSFTFKLAEGKTIDDAAFALEGSETVFTKIHTNAAGATTNVYGLTKDNVKVYGVDGDFEVTAFFIGEEPEALTISVAAGDVVYLQDGTVVEIAEANEAYEIPTTAGTVVVNSGFAGQKVYTVADNKVTEDTAKADGVLSTNEASIRDDETASGIRYKSTFLTALKNTVDEYGYITTVESAHNALPADYVLNMALVDAGKAVKDEAYIKGTDVDTFWNVEDDKTIVTAVVTNVPMTKEGVTTNIVIRPYYMVGEFVVYGEPMTRTVYEVALNIKENDAETYAKYQEYIDEILALCEETDVVIDFGPLFK